MKKLLIMLFIISVAASMSMAAVKKYTPMDQSASSSAPTETTVGNLAIGTSLGYPTLKYNFNSDFSGALGLTYTSGGGTSMTALLIKADYNLAKIGQVQPSLGLFYTTNGAAAATTDIGLIYGLSTMVLPNFSLGADCRVLDQGTFAGASTTYILRAVTLSAALYL